MTFFFNLYPKLDVETFLGKMTSEEPPRKIRKLSSIEEEVVNILSEKEKMTSPTIPFDDKQNFQIEGGDQRISQVTKTMIEHKVGEKGNKYSKITEVLTRVDGNIRLIYNLPEIPLEIPKINFFGVDPSHTIKESLISAIKNKNYLAFVDLIKYKMDLNFVVMFENRSYLTPLTFAIRHFGTHLLTYLMKSGANPSWVSRKDYESPMAFAVRTIRNAHVHVMLNYISEDHSLN